MSEKPKKQSNYIPADRPQNDFEGSKQDLSSHLTMVDRDLQHLFQYVQDTSPVNNFKVGSFTRSTTTASGTQAVTGVGFQPKALILFATSNTAKMASWGFTDGTSNVCMIDLSQDVEDTYSYGDFLIFLRTGLTGTTDYHCVISSFDSDGFTVSWTKEADVVDGLTIGIQYLAIR